MTPYFDFAEALRWLRAGKRVRREGWNGKGMWLVLMSRASWVSGMVDRLGLEHAPFIGMRTADAKFVPWLASQTDLLAEDWTVDE